MDNILIVTGGYIDDAFFLKIKERLVSDRDCFIIGVDKGLDTLDKYDIKPDLAIGDFDSAEEGTAARYKEAPGTIILNPKKDFTDSHVALMEAVKLAPEKITFVGATGSRIDHMMGNIALLAIANSAGIDAYIVDANNRIRIIDKHCVIKKDEQYGRYVSLLPFTDKVSGITLSGFLYGLEDASIIKEETIGISNEIRKEEGRITIKEGKLIVMETKD